MLKINDKIIDWSFEAFQAEQIKQMKLSDFAGKWLVILFYPADFTFVCPTELGELADNHEAIKAMGGEVISFSTDTVYTHKAWHDASPVIKKITYAMGADPTGNIARYFGTYIDNDGLSLRGTFIIDPEGLLKTIEIHDNSIGRSSAELIRKIQAAQFVRDHGGEVCPASWKPGATTLKPGLDLVGKI